MKRIAIILLCMMACGRPVLAAPQPSAIPEPGLQMPATNANALLLCVRDTAWAAGQIQCGPLSIPVGHTVIFGVFGTVLPTTLAIDINSDSNNNGQPYTLNVTQVAFAGTTVGVIGNSSGYTPASGRYTISINPSSGYSGTIVLDVH